MADSVFTIDLNETFPRLARAPIVEAIIHWQARAEKDLDSEALRLSLAEKLSKYPQVSPMQGFGLLAKLSAQGAEPVVEHKKKGFVGLRLSSEDGSSIVQFRKDGLVFSRTGSYEHWASFDSAARQAWQVFAEIASPMEITRLGVRFINHLAAATPDTLQEYLREPPTCPSNLPLKEFVYQSIFAVPAHPFGVRVIKVMQPALPPQVSGLILDIDVYTTNALPTETAEIDRALSQMRWLKNKVFFTLLKDKAVKSFS